MKKGDIDIHLIKKMKADFILGLQTNTDYIKLKFSKIDSPIKYFFWSGIPNFGDRLMPLIIQHYFPDIKLQAVSLDNAELIGIGSLLTIFNSWEFKHILYDGKKNPRIFWGSGMLNPDKNTSIPNSEIVSVRGRLSQELMGLQGNLVLGDPGLLISGVIPKQNQIEKILIVPHFEDFNDEKLQKFYDDKRFEIVDVREEPEKVIKKLSSASFILSSSLHGLVIADSYKIPNALYNISDNMRFFKYDDYYSATNREKLVVDDSINLLDDLIIESVKQQYIPISNLEQLQKEIIETFPFKSMEDVIKWRKLKRLKKQNA